VVPVLGCYEAIRAGVANQPDEPIVRSIDPCPDYHETFLLSQWYDATLPACDPVVHVPLSDPVVPELNLHDVEYPPDPSRVVPAALSVRNCCIPRGTVRHSAGAVALSDL
jgi:hypothetical protein